MSRLAKSIAAQIAHGAPEALLAASEVQLAAEEQALRAARRDLDAAQRAAGAVRAVPSREEILASLGAFLDALGTVAPQEGNQLLRRAIGEGGLVAKPHRTRWEITGALRLGALLANSGAAAPGPSASLAPRRAPR